MMSPNIPNHFSLKHDIQSANSARISSAGSAEGSATLQVQLQRLDSSLSVWLNRIEGTVEMWWPLEMFTRVPPEGEIRRRWEENFRALTLLGYNVHYECDSPSPWRARRYHKSTDSRYYIESFLPQIGAYLNHSLDANPPEDARIWHSDVAKFFAFCFQTTHLETSQVAREVDRVFCELVNDIGDVQAKSGAHEKEVPEVG